MNKLRTLREFMDLVCQESDPEEVLLAPADFWVLWNMSPAIDRVWSVKNGLQAGPKVSVRATTVRCANWIENRKKLVDLSGERVFVDE